MSKPIIHQFTGHRATTASCGANYKDRNKIYYVTNYHEDVTCPECRKIFDKNVAEIEKMLAPLFPNLAAVEQAIYPDVLAVKDGVLVRVSK